MSESLTSSSREQLIETLRQGARAIERRDRETLQRIVAESWHEDCEWVPLIAAVEGEATYKGHEGLLAFYEDLWNSFEVHYGEPEFRLIGGSVVYLTTMQLRGRESGIEVKIELGVVWEFDGGLIRRGRAFDSYAAAIAAAERVRGPSGDARAPRRRSRGATRQTGEQGPVDHA